MMQCKHHISIHRKFDMSKIDKGWYKMKGIPQSSNYDSYSFRKIYAFHSCLENDEDNLEIFDIHNNNETELGWTFDENLVNFDQPDDIEEMIGNIQTIESTEILSYQSFSSICNKLYSVMKNNNKISTFIIGMLLEMKEVIISKKTNILI